MERLKVHSEDFAKLNFFKQAYVLLQIQGVLGRIKAADLKDLEGKQENGKEKGKNSGIMSLSLNLSSWKKYYKDVRIIDRSASGLFEKVSENLLDLL